MGCVAFVCSASNFRRAIVMPNLKPPVTTTSVAITNRESIMKALPHGSSFDPLMTLYLIDKTHPDEIKLAPMFLCHCFFLMLQVVRYIELRFYWREFQFMFNIISFFLKEKVVWFMR